uniref:Uncharacterized protein n=1 Tax=Cannabis sativa TaxID=3483 RepID=A0A803PIC5_CANSA
MGLQLAELTQFWEGLELLELAVTPRYPIRACVPKVAPLGQSSLDPLMEMDDFLLGVTPMAGVVDAVGYGNTLHFSAALAVPPPLVDKHVAVFPTVLLHLWSLYPCRWSEHTLENTNELFGDKGPSIEIYPKVELENKQLQQRLAESNQRNAKLERKATAVKAACNNVPPNQPNTSTRRLQGRPRGSRTSRHGETPRGDNHKNPMHPQDDQPGSTRDIPVDIGGLQNPRSTNNIETRPNNLGTSRGNTNCENVQPDNPESS